MSPPKHQGTTELSPLNAETENANTEKERELGVKDDRTVTPLRLKALDSYKIKPDVVGIYKIFFKRTYFQKFKVELTDKQVDEYLPDILKIIPHGLVLVYSWLLFLWDQAYPDDQWLKDADKTPRVFLGQIRNGKFVGPARKNIESRQRARQLRLAAVGRWGHPPRVLTELDRLWNRCLEEIEKQILPESFTTWFAPTCARSFEDGLLTIAVPNQFVRKCLIENYRDLIETTVKAVAGEKVLVDFCIESEQAVTV